MARPRSEQISLADTPYYHLVSRCVRRAFLCGEDRESGQSYEHRRQWVEDRIRLLASLFAIEVAAYAVMSNHYHIVVKLVPDQLLSVSDREILRRWSCLYKGPFVLQRYTNGQSLNDQDAAHLAKLAADYRDRLSSLSWFMKCLNEPIARRANQEDNCTGHFWESRYKSQPLLNEAALLSCMAYVDLNPVRATMAATPETSEHTSIKERIKPTFDLGAAVGEQVQEGALRRFDVLLRPLLAFSDQPAVAADCLPFAFKDYLELVDFTGRLARLGKRGSIASMQPPILQRLGIEGLAWLAQATEFEKHFKRRQNRGRPRAA
jgi:REP element-mobilizing transposase RayT